MPECMMLNFMQSLNLLCGRPRFRFPELSLPYMSCLGSLHSSIRIMCPSHRSWAFRIMVSMLVVWALSRTSRFVTQSCQWMFTIICRFLMWNFSSCFRCLLYKVHVSHPQRRLVRTMALYTFSFVDSQMLYWFRMRARRWSRAWLALQILVFISLSRLLSLLMVLPRYVKSATVFSRVP